MTASHGHGPGAPHRSAERARAWAGPPILSRGFRPFFLGAGVWALAAIALWALVWRGAFDIPTAFSLPDWHAHEMIFGYASAVVAGFLLTAVPNWTGRLPVSGLPLAGLACLWAAGRVAVAFSAAIGRVAACGIDVAFLAVFAAVIANEVIAGRNTRNIKVAALVGALALGNLAFHVEDARFGLAEYSTRAAIAFIVTLILLIGGRVTPSFTGNVVAKTGAALRPVPFGRADGLVLAGSGVALGLWVVAPAQAVSGGPLVVAGAANLWRLSRWRGLAIRRDALLLVLHAGYLLTSLGFLAAGAAALWPAAVPYAIGLHVWGIGGIGVMTLAMMTRATLGHTGRALVASPGARLAYVCVVLALIARLAMAFAPDFGLALMDVAALLWIAGFATFLAIYGPMLVGKTRGA